MIRSRLFHPASLGFLAAYSLPLGLIGSAWMARHSLYPNLFAWVPLIASHGLAPIVEAFWSRPAPVIPAAVAKSRMWRAYYDAVPVLSLPAQLAMLYVAGDLWASGVLDWLGRIGLLLSSGIYCAMFGITISHELIHHPQRWQRTLGGVLLSTVCLGSFKTSHLQIHHRLVGTPLDFSTARRGQSLYSFWRQSLIGNFYDAFRSEREHLVKAGKPIWQSELIIWYGWSEVWFALAVTLWGWAGAIFFVAQGLIAILKLDCINYLQHYAVVRRQLGDGHFEHVQPHHTWSNDRIIDDFVLLNLPRHAEHHVHAHTPYYLLPPQPTSPQYPVCYGWMCLIALVPPLFRRMVHPCLDANEQRRLAGRASAGEETARARAFGAAP